jgi:3-oxoacyl-[acyl-carrier-protein] synthase-1
MKNLFNDHMPSFSSTKTSTGHCLGAAGAVEAVFSAFAIMYNELYPNLRFATPIPETEVIPETKFIKKPVNHVLSNSFGFGGCDTSLVFSKVI